MNDNFWDGFEKRASKKEHKAQLEFLKHLQDNHPRQAGPFKRYLDTGIIYGKDARRIQLIADKQRK